MLLQDEHVRDKIKLLTPSAYQDAIEWIRKHFTFAFGQQIDWRHDPDAVTGNIQALDEKTLAQLLGRYNVELSRTLTIIWAYADIGVTMPLTLIARHIHTIWLPVIDDVFVLDLNDSWCLEFHHEGAFSCGRYGQVRT